MRNLGRKKWENEELSRFRIFCSFLVVFMMAGLFHTHHWNEYFFEIFELKAAQAVGVADRGQLIRVAEICKARNKHLCQVKAYREILERNGKDYVAAELLAETQYLMGQSNAASETLEKYFLSGGDSVRAVYIHARVNESLAKNEDAEKLYKKAIAMKPHVLQISVSEDYVKLLMKQAKYRQAKKFIDKMRRQGAPSYFLSTEYLEIKRNIRNRSS